MGESMKRFVFLVVAIATLSTVATVWSANQSPMVMQKMDIMPLAFTQNNGQWADSILFRANAHGATIWFTDGGVYYQFTRRLPNGDELDKFTPTQATRRPNCDLNDVGVGVGSPDPNNLGPNVGAGGRPPVPDDRFNGRNDSLETMLIKASFVGANPNPQMRGDGLMEYKCNYFLGNDSTKWRTDVPNYQAIVFENIYAGIDLKYYGDGRKMEYDFVVSPGADPSQICMRYDGAKSLAVNDAGDLVVETDWGTVTELAPMVYQIENGERLPLRGSYQLESDDMFSFRLSDDYNPELAVVIDPVLTYSTYLGGGNSDEGIGIAIDGFGDVYAMGRTQSSNFPTQNPYDGSFNGFYDVFVTKFSAAGNTLVYSTYIGGDTLDEGRCIAIDGSGCAYVTGFTTSYNYPTLNAYDSSFHGGTYPPIDAFVTKLSSAGNSLVYSTFLGGV